MHFQSFAFPVSYIPCCSHQLDKVGNRVPVLCAALFVLVATTILIRSFHQRRLTCENNELHCVLFQRMHFHGSPSGNVISGNVNVFLGLARRSRGGLIESCTCRLCGPPPPPTSPARLTPLSCDGITWPHDSCHVMWRWGALGLYAVEAYLLCSQAWCSCRVDLLIDSSFLCVFSGMYPVTWFLIHGIKSCSWVHLNSPSGNVLTLDVDWRATWSFLLTRAKALCCFQIAELNFGQTVL